MELKEIAFSVSRQIAAEEMGIPEAEVIDDMEDFDKEMMVKFATRFLAAVDVERGMDAVDAVLTKNMIEGKHPQYGTGLFASFNCVEQVFRSPTIPEGMVLVPLIPTEEILDAMCDTSRAMPDDGDLVIQYNAILKAAGVTK